MVWIVICGLHPSKIVQKEQKEMICAYYEDEGGVEGENFVEIGDLFDDLISPMTFSSDIRHYKKSFFRFLITPDLFFDILRERN